LQPVAAVVGTPVLLMRQNNYPAFTAGTIRSFSDTGKARVAITNSNGHNTRPLALTQLKPDLWNAEAAAP